MTLTVGDLKKALSAFPDEMCIIISPDDEGNNLHHAHGVGTRFIEDIEQYYLESVHDDDATEDDAIVLEIW